MRSLGPFCLLYFERCPREPCHVQGLIPDSDISVPACFHNFLLTSRLRLGYDTVLYTTGSLMLARKCHQDLVALTVLPWDAMRRPKALLNSV